MTKDPSHIVFYKTDLEADRLLITTLQEHFSRICVVDNLKEICQQLMNQKSKIFLITGDTTEQCLATYYRSLDAVNDYTVCEHKVVALLPRHCEEEAYEAFRSGMIDDYLVARPLYEIHRVLMICEHLLTGLGVVVSSSKGILSFVEQSEHYAKETQTSIARHLLRKDVMREAFEKSLHDIGTALDRAAERIQQHQSVNLNITQIKETLATIRSDEIRPELLQLQQKAMDLLEQAVEHSHIVDEEPEVSSDSSHPTNEIEPAQDKQSIKERSEQDYVFNRLYQQQVNPEELLQKQSEMPCVLVVEDDAISIQLTHKLLTSYNIKVDLVSNGRQAFAALTSQQYNLVLMDITLPDTNGIYIADQVTSGKGPNSQTPIIILSSTHNKEIVTQAIERGAKGYIIKPLYKESLKKIFERFDIPLHAKGH